MRISYSVLLSILYTFLPVSAVLRCLSGHSRYPTQCTSQSYCVTITSKTGPVQRSCDGNAISQVSLCSMYAMHSIPRVQVDYSNYPISMGGPSTISKSGSSSLTRNQRRAPMQMCFNAGDLGEVCCCNTDYCNSGAHVGYRWITSILLITWILMI
ncbi:unnamed protein product [Caenorhabditis bovis]|uniref:Uncharacterized protein n=1 Tax=Caenorhabditis bovis TaxID=2654633 RepID=A0A8S1E1K9_9PELO|nr:unnamed protein product [Caenorhabditis bovis]